MAPLPRDKTLKCLLSESAWRGGVLTEMHLHLRNMYQGFSGRGFSSRFSPFQVLPLRFPNSFIILARKELPIW